MILSSLCVDVASSEEQQSSGFHSSSGLIKHYSVMGVVLAGVGVVLDSSS